MEVKSRNTWKNFSLLVAIITIAVASGGCSEEPTASSGSVPAQAKDNITKKAEENTNELIPVSKDADKPIAANVIDSSQSKKNAKPEKDYVQFDGQKLYFAFQGTNPGESFKEYIPEGEKLESWTHLASIREYPDLDDPQAVVDNLVHLLKQQNPDAQSSVIHNSKTGDVIVDFVTWLPGVPFVEFNVFRYSKKPEGGLIAQQYAIREYKDPPGFLRKLKPIRIRLVNEMAKDGLRLSAVSDH